MSVAVQLWSRIFATLESVDRLVSELLHAESQHDGSAIDARLELVRHDVHRRIEGLKEWVDASLSMSHEAKSDLLQLLVIHVDERIKRRMPTALSARWPPVQSRWEPATTTGGTLFYEKVDLYVAECAVESRRDDALLLLRVAYACLEDGFQGALVGDPDGLAARRSGLRERLEGHGPGARELQHEKMAAPAVPLWSRSVYWGVLAATMAALTLTYVWSTKGHVGATRHWRSELMTAPTMASTDARLDSRSAALGETRLGGAPPPDVVEARHARTARLIAQLGEIEREVVELQRPERLEPPVVEHLLTDLRRLRGELERLPGTPPGPALVAQLQEELGTLDERLEGLVPPPATARETP